MPLPRGLARANRYFINPVARRVAGWAPGFCILTHIGRRSGREYRLPLNVFRSGDTFVFALTYGSNADWVRNVMAAVNSTRFVGQRSCLFHAATSPWVEVNASRGVLWPWRWMSHSLL